MFRSHEKLWSSGENKVSREVELELEANDDIFLSIRGHVSFFYSVSSVFPSNLFQLSAASSSSSTSPRCSAVAVEWHSINRSQRNSDFGGFKAVSTPTVTRTTRVLFMARPKEVNLLTASPTTSYPSLSSFQSPDSPSGWMAPVLKCDGPAELNRKLSLNSCR